MLCCSMVAFVVKYTQGFHLQGNFLKEENLDTCKEKCKEIRLTRKWQGYFVVSEKRRNSAKYSNSNRILLQKMLKMSPAK